MQTFFVRPLQGQQDCAVESTDFQLLISEEMYYSAKEGFETT
jgi:hypothetical protein